MTELRGDVLVPCLLTCLLKFVDYDDNDCLPVKLDDDACVMERANADGSEDRLMKRSHARTGCRCVSEQEAARAGH